MNFDLNEYKDTEGVSLTERALKFAAAANLHGFAFVAILFDGPLENRMKWLGNVEPTNAWEILLNLSRAAYENKATLDFSVTGDPTRME